jgi:hypothetical protein
MHARDETILFSVIAILLVSLGLGGLADLASANAQAFTNTRELHVSRAVANGRQLHVSRDTACTSAAAAPAARSGAEQRG